jgi:ABC-type bacteriocin/lantibiotic exporter with double-glycine peptidase domain
LTIRFSESAGSEIWRADARSSAADARRLIENGASAFIGLNGSGKTTFARLINGLGQADHRPA